MNDKEINITIAKICGWKQDYYDEDSGFRVDFWRSPILSEKYRYNKNIPDYLNDLNACHEMESTLKKEDYWSYINELVELTGAEWTDAYDEVYVVAHATARQRCHAFLNRIKK